MGSNVTGENKIVRKLQAIAAKLTSDAELQKDVLQEMFIHMLSVESRLPGRTPSWYIKSCEFHARNFLKHGRSVDSLKRSRNLIPLGQTFEDSDGQLFCLVDVADPQDGLSEMVANDIIELMTPQLNATQQVILEMLLKGLGVREIARQMKVTHPAVIKHRRKIAQIAGSLLNEADIPTTVCAPPRLSTGLAMAAAR